MLKSSVFRVFETTCAIVTTYLPAGLRVRVSYSWIAHADQTTSETHTSELGRDALFQAGLLRVQLLHLFSNTYILAWAFLRGPLRSFAFACQLDSPRLRCSANHWHRWRIPEHTHIRSVPTTVDEVVRVSREQIRYDAGAQDLGIMWSSPRATVVVALGYFALVCRYRIQKVS